MKYILFEHFFHISLNFRVFGRKHDISAGAIFDLFFRGSLMDLIWNFRKNYKNKKNWKLSLVYILLEYFFHISLDFRIVVKNTILVKVRFLIFHHIKSFLAKFVLVLSHGSYSYTTTLRKMKRDGGSQNSWRKIMKRSEYKGAWKAMNFAEGNSSIFLLFSGLWFFSDFQSK